MKLNKTKRVEEIKNKLESNSTEPKTKKKEGWVEENGVLTKTNKRTKIDSDALIKIKINFDGDVNLETGKKAKGFFDELVYVKGDGNREQYITHEFLTYLRKHHRKLFQKGHIEVLDKEYLNHMEVLKRLIPDDMVDEQYFNDLIKFDNDGYIIDKDAIKTEYNNGDWHKKVAIGGYVKDLLNDDKIRRTDEEILREFIHLG